jgi:muramidase (phage lysozyme)
MRFNRKTDVAREKKTKKGSSVIHFFDINEELTDYSSHSFQIQIRPDDPEF